MDKESSATVKTKARVIGCIAVVVLISLVDRLFILLPVGVFVLLALVFMELKNKIKLKGVILIMLTAFMLSAIQALTAGRESVYSLRLPVFTFHIYKEGINLGTVTFLRIFGSMGVVFLFLRFIKMDEFLMALRWLGVPGVFIEIMVFAVKYIYIFREEAQSVIRAQKSRLGYKGYYRSIVSMSSVAGIVLSRAYDRSKVLAKSMQSRGYNGNT